MLQSKLNQYPVEIDVPQTRTVTNPQQPKRTSTHLAYNANRYSPKTTPRGPTTSTVMRPKSSKNSNTRNEKNQAKRHTIAATDSQTFHLLNRVESSVPKIKHKPQTDDDEEELQLKSAPVKPMLSTQNLTNTVEVKKLTASIESMRTSVLQA